QLAVSAPNVILGSVPRHAQHRIGVVGHPFRPSSVAVRRRLPESKVDGILYAKRVRRARGWEGEWWVERWRASEFGRHAGCGSAQGTASPPGPSRSGTLAACRSWNGPRRGGFHTIPSDASHDAYFH